MARRVSIHLPGVSHAAPIPMGAKVGNVVYSSAISGHDAATDSMPDDPAKQAEALFKNIRTFMEVAGGTTDDIVKMDVLLKDDNLRDAINTEWLKMFPDEDNRPARHAQQVPLRGRFLFQVELVAVLDK